jgi:hypothetical protein
LSLSNPFQVIGFHSCDKKTGLAALNGSTELLQSDNPWDWLGKGIYFWELNPSMALDYAIRTASGEQRNAKRINTPFVIGAVINLGVCLNLLDLEALSILRAAHSEIERIYKEAGKPMPTNQENIHKLDCTVFRHIHKSRKENSLPDYDTVRCAFQEDKPIYEGTSITSKLHIQISVLNPQMIQGYFLPRPFDRYNPYLQTEFLHPAKD